MNAGDLIRSYKTKQLGIVIEVLESAGRVKRKDKYGNIFPPLIPIKVIFPGSGDIKCLMNTQVEVLNDECI